MTFTPRSYDEIVRDLLTSLTGGRVAEVVDVPAGDAPLVLPPFRDRPVRRISYVEGFVHRDGAAVPYRFTAADYELETGTDGDDEGGRIRFRPGGRRPAPGTRLTVNYYPAQTRPVPLTDVNVGSVVRTLLETVARELAMGYQQLDHVYRSAFLDSAEAAALEKVVALVGARRLPAGHPVVKLRLSRRAGTQGRITVPAGTAATDGQGARYLSAAAVTFEPNETVRDALFVGELPATPEVDANAVNRFETVIAGLSNPTNPRPAWRLAQAESDDDLRRRARGVLHAVPAGTVDALRHGLTSIRGVNDVQVREQPNGIPGEVAVDVVYSDGPDRANVAANVAARIERLRPAGIRVVTRESPKRSVEVDVRLVLAGSGVQGDELDALVTKAKTQIEGFLRGVGSGRRVTQAKALSAVLADDRIAEAELAFRAADGTTSKDLELKTGESLQVLAVHIAEPIAEASTPRTAKISGVIPVILAPGITAAEARAVVERAVDAHLVTRDWQRPLAVDGLLAAVRDETRYGAVRESVSVTVELEGTFTHLVDGSGTYSPAKGDKMVRGEGLSVEIVEGGA